MRVSATNLSLNPLSTDIGLIQPGATVTVSDVSPVLAHKMALGLKSMVDAGRLSVSVSEETNRLDSLESLQSAYPQEALIQTANVTVTSAEILALNATPKTIVAAPGTNKSLVFEGMVLYMPYNSAAYSGVAAGEDLQVKLNNSGGAAQGGCEVTGFLDQTSSQTRYMAPFKVAAASTVSDWTPSNQPLVLHMLTGEITTGDSPLLLRVYYRVIPTVLS